MGYDGTEIRELGMISDLLNLDAGLVVDSYPEALIPVDSIPRLSTLKGVRVAERLLSVALRESPDEER